jgi:hypothetical protein
MARPTSTGSPRATTAVRVRARAKCPPGSVPRRN